ncbi:MAG: helix-turn-helix domain-containing protein [Bacteroidetes bacterium]|jgi:y4mF family transcriptional regulator|nr:helix-turn-helix domain-containing protein [Bacteroidota bacterium]
MSSSILAKFVKEKRKALGLTQVMLAKKAGVGLRLVRDLEQGRRGIRVDKANQILKLFGYEVGPVKRAPADEEHSTSREKEGRE